MLRVVFLLIVGLLGTTVLLSLGIWQVNRLAWKTAVLAEIEARIAEAPVALPAAPDPERDRYKPVTVDGAFLDGELHVLVSVKQVGPGYRIVAPFAMAEGRRVMVDRGFVPTEAKTAAREIGPATVTGNLHWPRETDSFTPEADRDGNVWFAREVPQMAAALGTEPVLIVAAGRTDPAVAPLPVDTAGIPNDHLEYALTWFSLAAIWAGMTGFFLWRTRARRTG